MGVDSRTVRLDVVADIAKYAAEMGKIPGVTQKEAVKAAQRLEAEMRKGGQKAGAAAGAGMATGVKAAIQPLRGLASQVLGPLGGQIGAMSDAMAGLGVSTAALGPIAVAAGAAMVAYHVIMREVADAVADLHEHTERATTATKSLGSFLGETYASERAAELAEMPDDLRRVAEAEDKWGQRLRETTAALEDQRRVATSKAEYETVTESIYALGDAADRGMAADLRAAAAKDRHAAASKGVAVVLAEERAVVVDVAAVAAEMANATEQLAAIRKRAVSAGLSGEAAISAELRDQLATIDQLVDAGGDLAEADAARLAVATEASRQIIDLRREEEEAAKEAAKEAADAFVSGADKAIAAAKKVRDAWDSSEEINAMRDGLDAFAEAANNIATQQEDAAIAAAERAASNSRQATEALLAEGVISEEQADARLAEIDRREAGDLRRIAATQSAAEKAAHDAYRLQQAAAYADIALNAAVLYVQMVRFFAFLGPFAPLAAAGVVVPVVAAEVAAVASTSPPTAHVGRVLARDEVAITAREGEAVLSERGVAGAGGADAVDALNRGMGGAGGSLSLVYRGRVVAEAVRDEMRAGGALAGLRPTRTGHYSPYMGAR